MMKKLIIIPAYNEQDCIVETVQAVKEKAPDYDYIVINDSSSDNTYDVCISHGFNVINLPVNLGIGGAIQTGYKYAYENGYDIAIQIDGDGQHDPSYLNDLISPIVNGTADICIGSRFLEKTGFQSSASRRLGIRFLSALIRLCTGTVIHDVTSGYRAVNREMIHLFSDYYPQDYPEPEAIVIAHRRGAGIMEVPVNMRERVSGSSSINLRRSVYYMIKVSLAILIEITRKKEKKTR